MTRRWSRASLEVYRTLDPRLQELCDFILHEVADIKLIWGLRSRDEQEHLFQLGRTKVQWPDSKHNRVPSQAVDWAPYPYPEDELKLRAALGYLAGAAKVASQDMGFDIRWGGDWDRDGDTTDQRFDDLFHIEVHDG